MNIVKNSISRGGRVFWPLQVGDCFSLKTTVYVCVCVCVCVCGSILESFVQALYYSSCTSLCMWSTCVQRTWYSFSESGGGSYWSYTCIRTRCVPCILPNTCIGRTCTTMYMYTCSDLLVSVCVCVCVCACTTSISRIVAYQPFTLCG